MNHQITRRTFVSSTFKSTLAFPLMISGAAEGMAGSEQPVRPKYTNLGDMLTRLRQQAELPALAAAVMKGGVVIASGANGVRKVGETTPVTILDKFHLGSCTKAMTATLAAILVEQGRMRWEHSLAQVFPERAAKMHSSFRGVTLDMLLTHRSGAAHDGTDYGSPNARMISRRLAYLDSVVNQPPAREPGAYGYSNAGYIIAGAMLERVTGQVWEELMRQRLFQPLGMTSAGFGPPSKTNQTDQPWGHVWKDNRFEPRYGDNPAPLGPAGTVHCALIDYLKFANLHVSSGERGPRLLTPASFAKLHRPPAGQDYAFGWIVVKRDWAKGLAFNHAGSNTMNYFVVWMAPRIDLCLAVATNAADGDNKVTQTVDKAVGELIRIAAGFQG